MKRYLALAGMLAGAVAAGASSAHAGHSYVGAAACVGTTDGGRGSFDYTTYGIVNRSTSRDWEAQCPVLHQYSTQSPLDQRTYVYVRDRSPVGNFACTHKTRTATGSLYISGRVYSSGTGDQTLYLSDYISSSSEMASSFVYCSVPRVYSGDSSSILGVKYEL